MAIPPPPYAEINGIYTTDDKHQAVSLANYDGTARPGQLVIDTTNFELYIGNTDGNVNSIYAATTIANTVGGGATVGISSIVNVSADFGSSDANDPGSAQGLRGRVTGSNLTGTKNYVIGTTGQYLITGTNSSTFPKAGIMGVVGSGTTTADAAVMAYLDGDSGLTTATSAFKVAMINSTGGSGFDYGLDLEWLSTGVAGTTSDFAEADIRLNNGLTIKSVTTSVTDGDATSLAAGTVVLTSNGTGVGKMFISNGSILKQLAFATP